MSGQYCTPLDISRFLFRNTQDFGANTLLSSSDVTTIIGRWSDWIDKKTKRSWATGGTAVTNDLLDCVYSDKWRWHGDYVAMFTAMRRPVLSVQKIEVVQGGTYVDITSQGPDRAGGWYNDPLTGEFFLVGTDMPGVLRKGVRLSYTWGDPSTLPGNVVAACVRYVAAEILQSENFAIMLPEDSAVGGTVAGKVASWQKEADKLIDQEIDPVVVTEG